MTDAERNLLSSILSPLGREFPDVDIIGDDYSEPRNAEIHDAARKVAETGRPVNPITVADAIGKSADLVYLHELVGLGVVPAQATYFAEIVAKEATRRRLKIAGGWLMQHADDEDPTATHDEIRGMLDRLPSVTTPVTRIGDTIDGTLNLLAEEDGGYVPTGWVDLNRFIGGWRPGAMYVGGARPGSGKSIIGAQAAYDVARSGRAVVICSMEMTDDELNTRLLAMVGQVNMDRLTRRQLSDADWNKVSTAQKVLRDLPIYTSDRASQTVAEIKSYVRAVQRRQPLGLLVVDYLQLIEPSSTTRRSPRHEQVGAISRGLKLIAKDLGIPVLALAQLNRGNENRSDKRPTLSDLRESGAIEQDSDVVLLLHRESDESTDLGIQVAKNRHGQRGAFNLLWRAHYACVTNHTDPFGRETA